MGPQLSDAILGLGNLVYLCNLVVLLIEGYRRYQRRERYPMAYHRPELQALFMVYAGVWTYVTMFMAQVTQRWEFFYIGIAYILMGVLFTVQDWVVDFGHWLRAKANLQLRKRP